MKIVNEPLVVTVDYDELMSFSNLNTNRCGNLTKEEALKNGYSEADWDAFVKRAMSLKKLIKNNGFNDKRLFSLGKSESGEIFILDGQGRRKALELLHTEDGVDFTGVEFKCNLFNCSMGKTEMTKEIIDMNIGGRNWKNKDLRRSSVLTSDDQSVIEAYNYTKKLMDDYELCDSVANLFTFGGKASHQRVRGKMAFSTADYAPYKDVFTAAYIKFVTAASQKRDKDGNLVMRNVNIRSNIRNTNFAMSYYGCLGSIVKAHGGDIEKAKNDIMYFTDRLIAACEGDDAYVKQFVKCDRKDKDVVANKVRAYCKKLNKKVYNELYDVAV